MRKTLLSLLVSFSALAALAQYSIDSSTIDGGGGTSTGGFWALPTAVKVTGAPMLTITPATPGNATISWIPNTPGYVLQETAVLSPANWTNSPSGSANPVTVPAAVPTKFYRLFKP